MGTKRPLALSSLERSVTPPAAKKRSSALPEEDRNQVEKGTAFASGSAHRIKIVSWNVNGTRPFLQNKISFVPAVSSPSPLRRALREHDWPHFLCLQEVKIAQDDLASQRQLQKAANDKAAPGEPVYEIVYSLPRGKFIGFGGKVHGVATLIRADFSPSLTATRRPEWDFEGRILQHEFHGLCLINGYWVNGTDHQYRNPLTGEVNGTRHDLKLRYHKLILEEVLRLERDGKLVVLVGDMNVAPAHIDGHPNLREFPMQHVINRKDFNTKFFGSEGMNGVDVFRHFRGQLQKYTWHRSNSPHGAVCDRVDLIIASQSLVRTVGAIVDADICDDAHAKAHSDHCPLWITLDLKRLPGNAEATGQA